MKLDLTTKELIKKLENKSAFKLAWAIIWRWFMIVLTFYVAIIIVALLLGLLIG